jgi:hypothetical protein
MSQTSVVSATGEKKWLPFPGMGRGKKSMSWVSVGAEICSRIIKLFFFVTDERDKYLHEAMFFQGSPIFPGKYGTYPS